MVFHSRDRSHCKTQVATRQLLIDPPYLHHLHAFTRLTSSVHSVLTRLSACQLHLQSCLLHLRSTRLGAPAVVTVFCLATLRLAIVQQPSFARYSHNPGPSPQSWLVVSTHGLSLLAPFLNTNQSGTATSSASLSLPEAPLRLISSHQRASDRLERRRRMTTVATGRSATASLILWAL